MSIDSFQIEKLSRHNFYCHSCLRIRCRDVLISVLCACFFFFAWVWQSENSHMLLAYGSISWNIIIFLLLSQSCWWLQSINCYCLMFLFSHSSSSAAEKIVLYGNRIFHAIFEKKKLFEMNFLSSQLKVESHLNIWKKI